MAMNIDLKNIDFKNLPQQSKAIHFGLAGIIVVIVLVIAYFAVFNSMLEERNNLKNEEETLKSDFAEKTARTTNLNDLEEELKQINNSFQALLKQLPTEAEIPNLIQELHQAAASNGLRLDSIAPVQLNDEDINTNSNQGNTKDSAKKSEAKVIKTLSYSIGITGSYSQVNNFIHDVGKLSRIVTLNHLNLKSNDKGSTLQLNAVANTYQTLSDAEIKELMSTDNKDK